MSLLLLLAGAKTGQIPPPVVTSGPHGPASGENEDHVLAAILRLKRKRRKKDETQEADVEIVKEALAAVVDDSEALEAQISEAQSSLDHVQRMVVTLQAREATLDSIAKLWREIQARQDDEDAVALLLMN